MRLILNEKELLNKALNDGYIDEKKPSNTIRLLVKHYLSIGMDKDQTLDCIDDFMRKNYKGYNFVSWMNSITRIINKTKKEGKYELIGISEIPISVSEVQKISELNSIRLEKLAFVLLVYAKIYNLINGKSNNWVNEQHKYIFSDAKVSATKEDQGKLLYKLKELGYIDVSVVVDSTNIKVKYIDSSNDVAFTITDFRNYAYEYFNYLKPEKYTRCEVCGLLIVLRSNRSKYCNKCADEILQEQKNKWKRENWDGRKLENEYFH